MPGPNRNRGQHIAFRFVNQNNTAVLPKLVLLGSKSEGTSRNIPYIFLLFGGVKPATGYTDTKALEEAHQIDWAERLGFDVSAMRNKANSRIIGWGGMEVPPAEMLKLYKWKVSVFSWTGC